MTNPTIAKKAQTKKIPTRKLVSDFLVYAQRSRRAQIKMFENIGVMIIFFFLLVFGASFYFTIQKASLEREAERINQIAAVQQALRLTFLPELDCSFAGVQTENCFDRLKVEALADFNPRSTLTYFNIFGYSNVTLRTIYSPMTSVVPGPITIYSRTVVGSYTRTTIPVLICEDGCDPLNLKYSFGLLEVDSYVPTAK
jgi:hypothetical protein